MKIKFLLLIFFVSFKFSAQVVGSSNTAIESCIDSVDCYTVKGPSYLFYDESKNDFYLKVIFAEFRRDGDTSDTWLNNPSDSILYFKADLQKERFPALSNQNTKSFILPGQIYFNHKWRDMSVTMNIYSSENSIVNTNNTNANLKYDNYKVNFSLPFVPKQFKNYKNPKYNKQTITINVTLGRINLFRTDMEDILDEVYNQPGR